MSNRITIDPITRIEGHLRIDVSIDDGKVSDSWASGTMFRGIETILTAATRARRGFSRRGSAVYAPRCMPSLPCARWKMPPASRFRRTRNIFVT